MAPLFHEAQLCQNLCLASTANLRYFIGFLFVITKYILYLIEYFSLFHASKFVPDLQALLFARRLFCLFFSLSTLIFLIFLIFSLSNWDLNFLRVYCRAIYR